MSSRRAPPLASPRTTCSSRTPAFPRGLDHFEAAAARLIELNRLGVSLQERKYGLAMKDENDLIKLASGQGSYETQ